jgi:AraC-like DNA-binding protein
MAAPCGRCGAAKPAGRGRRLCDRCATADPAQLARELETARMASRLWREKNGKVVRPVAAEDYAQANRHWRTPAAPVLALIDAFLAETGLPEKELAALAGVSPRLLYRLHYEHQEMLTVATADRLLLALGSHLDLVEDS